MATLCLVGKISELNGILRLYSQSLTEFVFVPQNNRIASELERLKLTYVEPQSVNDTSTAERNGRMAYGYAAAIYREVHESIEAKYGVQTPFICEELAWPFEILLNSYDAFTRILRSYEIERIIFCGSEKVGMARNGPAPAFIASNTITRGVVKALARKKGIIMLESHSPDRASERDIWRRKRKVPAASQQTYQVARGGRLPQRNPIILFRDGLWQSEIDAVRSILSDIDAVEVLEVTSKDLMLLSQLSVEATPQLHVAQAKHELIEAGMKLVEIGFIFNEAELHVHLEAIAKEICRAVTLREVVRQIAKNNKPRLAIFGHDAFTVEQAFEEVFASEEIRTVSLFHGGLYPNPVGHGIVGRADALIVWNAFDAEILKRFDYYQGQKLILGSLRFSNRLTVNITDSANSSIPVIESKTTKSILLLTAPVQVGMSFPYVSANDYRNAWREISRLAIRNEKWRFTIRTHPAYDDLEYYKDVIASSQEQISLSKAGTAILAAANCDVAVTVNYSTTAAIDVISYGKPVVFLANAICDMEGTAKLLEKLGGIVVWSTAELEEELSLLLTSRERYCDAIERCQKLVAILVGGTAHEITQSYSKYLREAIMHPERPQSKITQEDGEWAQAHTKNIETPVSAILELAGLDLPVKEMSKRLETIAYDVSESNSKRRDIIRVSYVLCMRQANRASDSGKTIHLALRGLSGHPTALILCEEFWIQLIRALITANQWTATVANVAETCVFRTTYILSNIRDFVRLNRSKTTLTLLQ